MQSIASIENLTVKDGVAVNFGLADLQPHGFVYVPDHQVYQDEAYDPQSLTVIDDDEKEG